MLCKNCKNQINIELKLISFIDNEMFVECPHCEELISENECPENIEIIRLTYNEEDYV